MSTAEENIIEVAAEPEQTIQVFPGEQLKAFREAQGVSVAEVAQALKFGVRQIEALERDDYQNLTGATFIRGFVRSYARYLKVDETPLLAALEPQAPAAVAEIRAVETVGTEMPMSVTPSSLRPLIVGLLIIGAVGAAWFAWQTYRQDNPTQAEITIEKQDAAVQQPTPQALEDQVTPTSSPVAPVPVSTAAVGVPTTAVNPPVAPVPPVAPAVVPLAADERVLALNFAGTSWVEVRDAQQRVILTGQYSANSQQSVRGKPPFQLVIGNAAQVQLKYGDRNIDLQPFIRAEVARLTLDDNSN